MDIVLQLKKFINNNFKFEDVNFCKRTMIIKYLF